MNDTGNGHGESEWSWKRTPSELERWIEYKRTKAHGFVDRGYSVEWTTDGNNWMGVYIPQRHDRKEPELRATAKIFEEPSEFGINGGRVSKLTIQTQYVDLIEKVLGKAPENVVTLFNYDRGDDVNRIAPGSKAERLYRDVIEILN